MCASHKIVNPPTGSKLTWPGWAQKSPGFTGWPSNTADKRAGLGQTDRAGSLGPYTPLTETKA